MIAKLIRVHVKPGRLSQYLAAQAIWNRETSKAPGYAGHFCGRDANDSNLIQLIFFWRSRADLDRWMADHHDRIESLARADEHFESHEVGIFEEVLPPPTEKVSG
jgi:heme-degrading monooxygenase HmoA